MAVSTAARQKPTLRAASGQRSKPGQKAKPDKAHVFAWEGTDRKGNRISGETRASNTATVRAELRRQGVNPLKVKKKASVLLTSRKKKITAGDIAVFSRQMATMLTAGVPVVQAFEIVGRGHENPSMQDLILSIKADIESGLAGQDRHLQGEDRVPEG